MQNVNENPEWGVGPFPWRVTPLEWACGWFYLLLPRRVSSWLFYAHQGIYLWIAAKAYTAEELPLMRRRWNRGSS